MSTRIVIAGGPRTGKTTLSIDLQQAYGYPVLHTDDLIPLGWSEASYHAACWMLERADSDWVLEGVAAGRALRKALDVDPRPCDKVIWLSRPHEALTKEQEAMAKGCRKVFNEIRPALEAAGVVAEER